MIRINLLEETRTLAKPRAGGLPKIELAENVPLFILAGGAAVAALLVVVAALYLAKTISSLDDSIAEAEREVARLKPILEQNEELNLKKQELNRRIGIIADLKSRQDLPVVLLDQLSKCMADHMWLDDMTYAGELVTLKGKALSPIAYSNFLGNLEKSKYFTNVASSRLFAEPASTLNSFTMTTTFRMPLPPGATPAAAPADGKDTKGTRR